MPVLQIRSTRMALASSVSDRVSKNKIAFPKAFVDVYVACSVLFSDISSCACGIVLSEAKASSGVWGQPELVPRLSSTTKQPLTPSLPPHSGAHTAEGI